VDNDITFADAGRDLDDQIDAAYRASTSAAPATSKP
jgi:hypothetical protein